MPILASALEQERFLRLLVLSWPKTGTTTHVVSTAPGPVRVLLCEASDSALNGALAETKDFDFERVTGWDTMMKFIVEAKRDAKEGKIKSVVVDPLNFFADRLMAECTKATMTKEGNEDGRRAHPELSKRLEHAVALLLTIPAHVIVTSHFMEVGGDDNGKPKSGKGLVPLMPNTRSKSMIAAMFHDIVWFDKGWKEIPEADQYNGRVFVVAEEGVFGPGGRHLKGAGILPGHVGRLIERSTLGGKKPTSAKPTVNGAPPRAPIKPTAPKPGMVRR
jgi:hypothetical protein